MAVFPTLDFAQIKARYPKGVKKITEWIFEQPELKETSEEFIDPKDPEKSKEMFTGLLIQMDPRKLYDIFDTLDIHVSVFKDNDSFWYGINLQDIYNALRADGRHSAEQTAFHDAFELLEKKL